MRASVGFWVVWGVCLVLTDDANGQGLTRGANGGNVRTEQPAAAYPDQPVQPQTPTLQPRDAQPQPGQPFPPLDAREQARLDRVLDLWEQSTAKVKTFSCQFTRFEYDLTRPNNPPKPDDTIANYLVARETGEIHFATPDKGSFNVGGPRPERWICDGNSVYAYNFQAKLITVHRLPPEMQGKAITEGPLPFLFGAKAARLKSRYFLHLVPPPDPAARNQVCLEAYPRFLDDARNFSTAQAILSANSADQTLVMTGLQIVQPGRTKWAAYKFEAIMINRGGLRGLLGVDEFTVRRPGLDWKVVEGETLGGPGPQPQPQPPPRPAFAPLSSRPNSPR